MVHTEKTKEISQIICSFHIHVPNKHAQLVKAFRTTGQGHRKQK